MMTNKMISAFYKESAYAVIIQQVSSENLQQHFELAMFAAVLVLWGEYSISNWVCLFNI